MTSAGGKVFRIMVRLGPGLPVSKLVNDGKKNRYIHGRVALRELRTRVRPIRG
jgi:hypothetical protein